MKHFFGKPCTSKRRFIVSYDIRSIFHHSWNDSPPGCCLMVGHLRRIYILSYCNLQPCEAPRLLCHLLPPCLAQSGLGREAGTHGCLSPPHHSRHFPPYPPPPPHYRYPSQRPSACFVPALSWPYGASPWLGRGQSRSIDMKTTNIILIFSFPIFIRESAPARTCIRTVRRKYQCVTSAGASSRLASPCCWQPS